MPIIYPQHQYTITLYFIITIVLVLFTFSVMASIIFAVAVCIQIALWLQRTQQNKLESILSSLSVTASSYFQSILTAESIMAQRIKVKKNFLIGLTMINISKEIKCDVESRQAQEKHKIHQEQQRMKEKINERLKIMDNGLQIILNMLSKQTKITFLPVNEGIQSKEKSKDNLDFLIRALTTYGDNIGESIIHQIQILKEGLSGITQKFNKELQNEQINDIEWEGWMFALMNDLIKGEQVSRQKQYIEIIKKIKSSHSGVTSNENEEKKQTLVYEINQKNEQSTKKQPQKETVATFNKKLFMANLSVLLEKGFHERQQSNEQEQF